MYKCKVSVSRTFSTNVKEHSLDQSELLCTRAHNHMLSVDLSNRLKHIWSPILWTASMGQVKTTPEIIIISSNNFFKPCLLTPSPAITRFYCGDGGGGGGGGVGWTIGMLIWCQFWVVSACPGACVQVCCPWGRVVHVEKFKYFFSSFKSLMYMLLSNP